MSRELSFANRIIRQFRWSFHETILVVSIIIFVMLYAALRNIDGLESSLIIVEDFADATAGAAISEFSDLIEGTSLLSQFALAAIWSVFGAGVYFLVWFVRTSVSDAKGTVRSVFGSVHPHGYNTGRVALDFFLRKLEFVSLITVVLVYGVIWSHLILQPIVFEIYSKIKIDIETLLIIPLIILLIVSLHVFALLFRFLKGEHHIRFAQY